MKDVSVMQIKRYIKLEGSLELYVKFQINIVNNTFLFMVVYVSLRSEISKIFHKIICGSYLSTSDLNSWRIVKLYLK